MNDEMDYEEEEYISHKDNKLTISNISYLNQPPIEDEFIRAIKFFQLMNLNLNAIDEANSQTANKIFKIKQLIQNYLLNSRERLDMLIDFIRLTTMERTFFKLKVLNLTPEKKNERGEMKKINFLKKLDYFEKSIGTFQNRMKEMNDNNKISQIIFKELISLKEYGLNVEDNFRFPDKKDIISIKLIHKNLKIYEKLKYPYSDSEDLKNKFNDKFNFNLKYFTKSGNFELNSEFYENFLKKFKLYFELKIKFADGVFILDKNTFDKFLDEIVTSNLNLNYPRNDKYNLKSHLLFFIKYFLYILFKIEIRTLVKLKENNFIYHKNLLFTFNEYGKEFSLTLNFFNFLEVSFKITKENIEDTTIEEEDSEEKNIFPYQVNKVDSEMQIDIIMNDSNIIGKFGLSNNKNDFENIFESNNFYLIKILFKNLIYDMRLYKYIRDLSMLNLKSKVSLIDYVDNSIFIKNFVKVFQVIIRKLFIQSITNKINNSKNFYLIKSNVMNPLSNSYSCRFIIMKHSYHLNTNHNKIEFCLYFHKNNILLEFKNPLKNSIYICERETFTEEVYERLDPQYLLNMIENLIE